MDETRRTTQRIVGIVLSLPKQYTFHLIRQWLGWTKCTAFIIEISNLDMQTLEYVD